MSAFHRVDDIFTMTPHRFFRFALRLPAYRGIVRARIEADEAKKAQRGKKMGGSGPVHSTTYHDPAVSGYFDEG